MGGGWRRVAGRFKGYMYTYSFQGGSVVKNTHAITGDTGNMVSIPESGRSPGVGNGNPLQYSCLDNSMERGTWWAVVQGVTKNWIELSD